MATKMKLSDADRCFDLYPSASLNPRPASIYRSLYIIGGGGAVGAGHRCRRERHYGVV